MGSSSRILKNNFKNILSVSTLDTLRDTPGEDGDIITVTDEYTGGVFIYNNAFKDTDDKGVIILGWVRQYSGSVNVRWFGAKGEGDQTYNDAIYIQYALDSYTNVYIPDGTYYLENSLVIDRDNTILYGDSYSTSNIIYNPHEGDAIKCTGHQIVLKDFKLIGPGRTILGVSGVVAKRANLTPDVDIKLEGVGISSFDIGVHIAGRGLKTIDCIYESVNYGNNIEWTNDLVPFDDTNPEQTIVAGFRAYEIFSCRVHSCNNVFVNTDFENGEFIKGVTISGNYLDGHGSIYSGGGQSITIAGNTLLNGGSSSIVFNRSVSSITITGNSFAGRDGGDTDDDYIYINTFMLATAKVTDCIISDNTFTLGAKTVFVFDSGTSGSRRITITNNVAAKVCKDNDSIGGYGLISFVDSDINYVNILSNSVFTTNDQSLAESLIIVGGDDYVDNIQILNNIYDSSIFTVLTTLYGDKYKYQGKVIGTYTGDGETSQDIMSEFNFKPRILTITVMDGTDIGKTYTNFKGSGVGSDYIEMINNSTYVKDFLNASDTTYMYEASL